MSIAETYVDRHIHTGLFPVGRAAVLIVEPRDELRRLLDAPGIRRQFAFTSAGSGKDALRRMHAHRPRLVIIDADLSDATAFDLCASIKSSFLTRHVPVCLVGSGEADEEQGRNAGADAYFGKPLVASQFLDKTTALLRGGEPRHDAPQSLCVHDLTIDPSRRCVFVGRKRIDLAIHQLQLLTVLASSPGRTFTHAELAVVLGFLEGDGTHDKLRYHTSSLRKRLGRAGCLIETVLGCGYRLKALRELPAIYPSDSDAPAGRL